MSRARSAGALPRRAARLVFRHHIENGLAVSLWLALVGIAAGAILGLDAAIVAATGAMCVSIVDQPSRLATKPPVFATAVVATSVVSLLAGLAGTSDAALAAVVAATGAGMALVTAYGRPALTLGIAGVLSLVLGLAMPVAGPRAALMHSGLFAAGGTAYAALALAAAWALDDRNRRLFLSEALRAFARFLAARARLYVSPVAPASRAAVIEAHGAFMERLQPARDAIFTGRATARRRRWIGGMVGLLDVYEAVLSTDADWDSVRKTAGEATLARIAALTRAMEWDVDDLALALVAPATAPPRCDYGDALAAFDRAAADGIGGLTPTRDKLAETGRRIQRLADALAPDGGAADLPAVDLTAFVQSGDVRFATLGRHLNLASPVMRYAIRLTLAMLAGFAITVALPAYVHGGWVLLTVALIMRASYALTRQRRNDRIVGTLAGCAAAAVVVPVLPTYGLLALVAVAAGAAHAFATTNYRVTTFAASLMALVLVHLIEPGVALVGNRILDTLIGAALSVAFAYLLPSWEWRDVPALVARLVAADRAFADQTLTVRPAAQDYRLARKGALDTFTALATATRRLAGEPRRGPHRLADVNALLGANYLFASDLASVQSLIRIRGHELDLRRTDAILARCRTQVAATLAKGEAEPPPPDALRRRAWTELATVDAATFLDRRLAHIENAAGRLAALAARAVAGGPD